MNRPFLLTLAFIAGGRAQELHSSRLREYDSRHCCWLCDRDNGCNLDNNTGRITLPVLFAALFELT